MRRARNYATKFFHLSRVCVCVYCWINDDDDYDLIPKFLFVCCFYDFRIHRHTSAKLYSRHFAPLTTTTMIVLLTARLTARIRGIFGGPHIFIQFARQSSSTFSSESSSSKTTCARPLFFSNSLPSLLIVLQCCCNRHRIIGDRSCV